MHKQNVKGKTYRKFAVKAGAYFQSWIDNEGRIHRERIYISPQFLRESAFSTTQIMKRSMNVPVCLDHQDDAYPMPVEKWLAGEMKSSVGLLRDVKYDPVRQEQEYTFEVMDDSISKKMDDGIITMVSPNFIHNFDAGDGTRWHNPIAHLALTHRPKDYRQSTAKAEPVARQSRAGQYRFSVISREPDNLVKLVPMHHLPFSVLATMARPATGGRLKFSSVDYDFYFKDKPEFIRWLNKRYQRTIKMSVMGKHNFTLYFAVIHAPIGGVNVNGRFYKGGQFIPNAHVESLPTADRDKLRSASAESEKKRTEIAGKYIGGDETHKQAIARHAGEHANAEMDDKDKQAAKRRWASLRAYHGDKALRQVAVLAGKEAEQLKKLDPNSAKAAHIRRRLRAYHEMAQQAAPPAAEPMKAAASVKGQDDDSSHLSAWNEMLDAQNDVKEAKQAKYEASNVGKLRKLLEGTKGYSEIPGLKDSIEKTINNNMDEEVNDINDETVNEIKEQMYDAISTDEDEPSHGWLREIDEAKNAERKAAYQKIEDEQKRKNAEVEAKRAKLLKDSGQMLDKNGKTVVDPDNLEAAKAFIGKMKDEIVKIENNPNSKKRSGIGKAKKEIAQMEKEIAYHESKNSGKSDDQIAKESFESSRAADKAIAAGPEAIDKQLASREANQEAEGQKPDIKDSVKKIFGFHADEMKDVHENLKKQDVASSSESYAKARASVLMKNHINSVLSDLDKKIYAGTITEEEGNAYDAVKVDKHFGDLHDKLTELGGAGYQQAWHDKERIEPDQLLPTGERYKKALESYGIDNNPAKHAKHKSDYEEVSSVVKANMEKRSKAHDEIRRLSDLRDRAEKNKNQKLVDRYERNISDAKAALDASEKGDLETVDKMRDLSNRMLLTNPSIPDFAKHAAMVNAKGAYLAHNPELEEAIKNDAVEYANSKGYSAEVGNHLAGELSRGVRIYDEKDFKRVLDRAVGKYENDTNAEQGIEQLKATPGFSDLGADAQDEHISRVRSAYGYGDLHKSKVLTDIAKAKEAKAAETAKSRELKKQEERQSKSNTKLDEIAKVAKSRGSVSGVDMSDHDINDLVHKSIERNRGYTESDGNSHKKFAKASYLGNDSQGGRYSFMKGLAETGWWTDGKGMVLAPDDLRQKAKEMAPDEATYPQFQSIVDMHGKTKNKSKIVGESNPDNVNQFPAYLVQDDAGNQLQVAKDVHARVMSLHPDAEMHINPQGGGMVVYKKMGEPVGFAVPLSRSKEDTGKIPVQNKVHFKDFTEPGPYKPEDMKEYDRMVVHPDGKAAIRINPNKEGKNTYSYSLEEYGGRYKTEAEAKKAAREILSHVHGVKDGMHEFRPLGSGAASADPEVAKRLSFHKQLGERSSARFRKKSTAKVSGKIPEGRHGVKDGEYEVQEYDDEKSPFKIVRHPHTNRAGRIEKKPDFKIVHKKSNAVVDSGWNNLESARKMAYLAESAHHWDFDTDDHFKDKGEEGSIVAKKLRDMSSVIENETYNPDIKFGVVHAPAGGTDVDGRHFLGGQFTPGEGNQSQAVSVSPKEQEKKSFYRRADGHAKNLGLKPMVMQLPSVGKVNGYKHGNLAIHKGQDGWQITHAPTGKRVGKATYKDDAIRKAYLLHHGLDWNFVDSADDAHTARFRDVAKGQIPRGMNEGSLSPGGVPSEHADLRKFSESWMKYDPNYKEAKQKYLATNGTFDENGNLRSVVANIDEWRDFIPGYKGTNAHEVHQAAKIANERFLDEMIDQVKDKGNKRVAILGGGGGSGKGTAVAHHFDEREYPLRLDQTSSDYDSLMARVKKFKDAGMDVDLVFVDRKPSDAWKGVVGRAVKLQEEGKHPRTVPKDVALWANIEARKVAARIAKEHPEINLRVIDNHNGYQSSKLLKDRQEILDHLERQNYNMDEELKEAHRHVSELEGQGKLPSHVARSLRGDG